MFLNKEIRQQINGWKTGKHIILDMEAATKSKYWNYAEGIKVDKSYFILMKGKESDLREVTVLKMSTIQTHM